MSARDARWSRNSKPSSKVTPWFTSRDPTPLDHAEISAMNKALHHRPGRKARHTSATSRFQDGRQDGCSYAPAFHVRKRLLHFWEDTRIWKTDDPSGKHGHNEGERAVSRELGAPHPTTTVPGRVHSPDDVPITCSSCPPLLQASP
jgi:hypothetical protein